MASYMGSKDHDKGQSGNRVPSWDGRPESFHHYVIEVKWHLAGMKASERPYAAARLVRKILESEYPALKTLVYKLDPSEFVSEDAVQRLISFLEASPMNRQPVPDAGRKLTAYYRRLQRKPQETIPQFLIREETLYDEMWRSLQRLLKEKQIDFDQYDTSLDELKRFCGMKDDQSIFVPGGSDGASRGTFSHTDPENPFDGESEGEQPPGMTTPASTIPIGAPPPKVERRGFDLIERLMQKGLIPLAALDIIRGWLVLESTSATELDKSLVKASTQNKLGYQNIRSALLALHEDRSRGIGSLSKGSSKGKFSHHFMDEYQYSEDLHYGEPWGEEQEYYGDWNEPYGEDGFYGEEFQQEPVEPSEGDPSQGDATQSEEQAVHALSQLEEEEKELAAMMADAQRNLEQARRAVAEAKKDRGWKSSSGGSHFGKGSPPHFGQKGTSTFMKGGKGKVNYMQRGRGKGQGRFQYPQRMNRFPPRRPPFMQNQSGMYMENDGFHFMSMMDVLPEDEASERFPFFPVDRATSSGPDLRSEEAILDSGATVSAGGQEAVNQLIGTIAQVRPDLNVTVVTSDRPYFRYGSGRWGQALFLAKLHFGKHFLMRIYALPSPGVPVLVGMREMQDLGLILNVTNGHAVLLNENKKLRITKKKQILLNFLKDLPFSQQQISSVSPPIQSSDASNFSRRVFTTASNVDASHARSGQNSLTTKGSQHGLLMLDILHEPNDNEHSIYANQILQDDDSFQSSSTSEHLRVSEDQFRFLANEPLSSTQSETNFVSSPSNPSCGHERADRRARQSCSSEGVEKDSGSRHVHWEDQKEDKSRVRYHQDYGGTCSRPSQFNRLLAMHGQTHSQSRRQQMGPMVGVRPLCTSSEIYSDKGVTSRVHSHCLAGQRDSSLEPPSFGGLHQGGLQQSSGQTDHQVHHQSGSDQFSEVQCEQGKGPCQEQRLSQECSGSVRDPDSLRRGGSNVRGDQFREEEVQSSGINFIRDMKQSEPQQIPVLSGVDTGEVQRDPFEPTPEEVLNRLHQNLADKIFHIDQELQLLQKKHLILWEICCSPNSTLTDEMQKNGFQSRRWNYEAGFDLEKPACVQQAIEAIPTQRPSKLWASLRCTPWTSIQNINQRTPQQIENLRKMRLRSRKQVRHVLKIFRAALQYDPNIDIYFEWPKGAKAGWSLQELADFERWVQNTLGKSLFKTQVDGCMVGLHAEDGTPLNKPWIILTTDQYFDRHCSIRCDGKHEHKPILGLGTHAVAKTAFYPIKFARRIVQVWKGEHHELDQPQILNSMNLMHSVQEIEPREALQDLGTLEQFFPIDRKRTHHEIQDSGDEGMEQQPSEQPDFQEILDDEADISTTEREKGRAILHRLHRAAGHPSNQSLARLLRDRKLPKWLINEASKLQCPHCTSTQQGNKMILHRSIGEHPRPWQIVGIDVMELPFPEQQSKARFLLMTCLTMNFVCVAPLWVGKMSATGTDSGEKIIATFCDYWLAHRPRPEWMMVDAQSSLVNGDFPKFLQTAGIGLIAAPGEGHWIHGKTEAMVKLMKRTMRRIRHEHPLLAPSLIASLATYASNHMTKSSGFSPIQWAYGYDPDALERKNDPLQVNAEKVFGPQHFQEFQQLRNRAGEIHRQEAARDAVTRIWNSAPRELVDYQVGDFVCIWRTMTLKARKRGTDYNPEARFFGPGRIVLIEPPVLEGKREAIIWVLCGTTLYRCAREQLRPATQQETLIEILRSGDILSRPRKDLLKELRNYVNVTDEHVTPDDPKFEPPDGASNPQQQDTVASLRTRWSQLVSMNENRRREGLPPVMQLPKRVLEGPPAIYNLEEQDPSTVTDSPGVQQADSFVDRIFQLDEDTQQLVFEKINLLDAEAKYNKETEQLRLQVEREREEQAFLLAFIDQDLQREEKDRQWVFQLEFDVTDEIATSGNPILYVKRILESKNTEVSYRQLAPEHIPLFDEAKAKEVSEVLGSLALRAIQSKEEFEDAMKHPERNIPMRWVLTWKPIIPPEPPEPGKPTTVVADGSRKAKARVVLLGFRHPDLVKRNPVTGQHELRTAAPTISRTGRNLLLQCFAFDEHRLESADAKSAFLQADNLEESRRIWTTAVPELARAHNVKPGELLRVLGAIYGLTNAPRIFWKDADGKLQKLGGKPHPMDRCIWTFVDPKTGIVCGRIGSQVDDFLIGGDEKNEHWQHVRSQIKKMYQWSPWQSGDFIYAGCHLRQLSSFTIHLSQEEFCDALRPVEISQDGSRSATDKMSPQELSQCRALVMKAQWRALQSAPQYSARVGRAASTLTNGNLQNLREANSLVRDMRKSSKENLVFHNFNFGKEKRMKYTDLIFAHWGDAGHNNRPTGGSTGGYVTGITVPQILSGKESPVTIVDWRSWKLRRPARGTNCSEAQGIAESEDKGWRCRLFFALLYGHDLIRGEADKLTALFTSFLIMDSRGCYDLLVGNESLAMSMEDSKAAIDLLHVQHGTSDGSNCFCTWVPSDLNLANSLTKATSDAFREMKLYHTRKSWIIKFNSEFISARKAQRLRVQKAKEEQDQNLHFADFPDQWFDDSWSALFGSPYQR